MALTHLNPRGEAHIVDIGDKAANLLQKGVYPLT
jgi:hypothetical protein